MKRISILLALLITLTSCGEELVFNTPAFIGYNGEAYWEATNYRANVDDQGYLTITGIRNLETINLKTTNSIEGSYLLGNTVSSATFENQQGTIYSTNSIPHPSVQIYPSEGNITITEFNLVERTVSGTFSFHAFDVTGLNSENFNRGYFYNVPILSIGVADSSGQTQACLNAIAVAATTQTNYNNVDPNGPQYTQFCMAYKTALEVKKQACGDTDGSIQAIINGLGDCSN
ncbi:DUF6252 family protein [Olleya aquimaris]|uniref:Lipoprotein n=1 Tax=Olleya aquimaris TaxID=639310 RepID=A0A327RNR7_9FLAO|nr:DUF6252 family protein [Olleya aquimaris]RAJ18141.1 hypothetical protein LY08_00414 [Olleya aquimaris]